MPATMKVIVVLAALIASVGANGPFLKGRAPWLAPADAPSPSSQLVEGEGCNQLGKAGKLMPDDPRVLHTSAKVRGQTYRYMVGEPESSPPVATVFLFHGFPDLGFGWRHQVPYLMCLGYRVVVPDMLGYAGSSRPEDLHRFSMRNMSADIKELAGQVAGGEQIILGGHDWGSHLAWRIAMWHPGLAKGIFSVCTPFFPPAKPYLAIRDLVAAPYNMKNFEYILQFIGPEVETAVRGKDEVRQFLNAMYGGLDLEGEPGWVPSSGVSLDKLHTLSTSTLLSEAELSHYVDQFMLQEAPPMRGPLNWYRTREIDWEEEWELANKSVTIETPTLFIAASRNHALPSALSAGMERHLPHLTRKEVNSSHWALWETSAQVNEMLGEWLPSHAAKAARPMLKL